MTNEQAIQTALTAMQTIISNNNTERNQEPKTQIIKQEIIKDETLLTAKLENVLLTVDEVRQILKISDARVRKLIKDGDLSAMKLGRLKVPYFEVERFLKDNLGRDFDEGEKTNTGGEHEKRRITRQSWNGTKRG